MAIRSRRYVIVGDGAAGMTAARTLRNQDADAEIVVLSDDPHPAYFRAALTNYLLGELREEQIWATPASFYERYRVRRLHARAISLDAAQRRLHSSNGAAYAYDALLIGSGARARAPSFEGRHLGGVMTLRTLQDCRAVMELLGAGCVRSATVVGGGPLGLEWALGMHARGVAVTVLLRGNGFMVGALDRVASDLLSARLRQAGVSLVFSDEVALARDVGNGRLAGLRTKAGREIPCDLLACAIGVIPNSEWLLSSAVRLSGSGAVVIDERARTSLPDVFAAGDVAEFQGRALQLWEPAQTQARVAARNMAGLSDVYAPGTHYMATRLFDLDFASLGQVSAANGAEERSELPSGTGTINYRKVVLDDDRLVGALMLGQREAKVRQRGRVFKRLIDSGVSVAAIKERLLDQGFDLDGWLQRDALQRNLAAANAAVAEGAQIRGTSLLDLSQLGSQASKTQPKEPATSVRGTQILSGFVVQQDPTPQVDIRAATVALGTQVLSTFNTRPETTETSLALEPKPTRPAFVLLGERRIDLHGPVVRIGRDPQSAVVLDAPHVDSIHAHIELSEGHWYLRDLGSRLGTWVGGESLNVPKRLATGDRITLGQTELIFCFADEAAQLAARVGPSQVQGAARPRFEIKSGHSLGLSFVLAQNPTLIGSDPSCGLWLSDPEVVGQHAHAEWSGSAWQLLARVPGVVCNGVPLAPGQAVALRESAQLCIGGVDVRFTETPLAASELDAPSTSQRRSTEQRARLRAFAAVSQADDEHVIPAISMQYRADADDKTSYGMPSISPAQVATRAGRLQLRVGRGPAPGATALLGELCRVGNSPDCELRLIDSALLPVHVEVRRREGAYWARAFGPCTKSRALLGEQFAPLTAGEHLEFGNWTLICESETR